MGSKGWRPARAVKVKWSVTADKTLGELTVRRFIDLHHLVPFGDEQLHKTRLQAWREPTESDPYWYFQDAGGEAWRFVIKSRFSYEFQVWWRYEWRSRSYKTTAKWARLLADSIDYGKKHQFVDREMLVAEPAPALDEEQQLTMF